MSTFFSRSKGVICRLPRLLSVALLLALGYMAPSLALTQGETYTVVISKVNSNGSLTNLSSTSAIADSNGKIAFDLTSLPDASQTHFVLLQVKDSGGNVVRQGIAPAPGPSSTNQVGINPLSNVQADALRAAMEGNQTDDPLAAAFGLVFIRSQSLASTDITGLSDMMAIAILGKNGGGMEDFLLKHGVSQVALNSFKDHIVYNSVVGSKDLSDYVAFFKTAVDNRSDADLAKAGGIMGDILIDAGAAAGIDPQLLLAAFNAAGGATGLDAAMASLSSNFQGSVNAAVSGFFTRVSSIALKKGYSAALAALGGSTALIARFNLAVQAFVTSQQTIDIQYGAYFMDPQAYLTAHPSVTEQQIQTAIDTAFQSAWGTFQTSIASSNAEIAAMLADIATAMGGGSTASQLAAQGIGKERDFAGMTVNWPIPQTVAVTWVANILTAGGTFSYTRDTTAVPTDMQGWLDSDDDPSNGTDGARHDFSLQMPSSFAALMGLMEDVQIVEGVRHAIWSGSAQPTPGEEEQARSTFTVNLGRLAAQLSGSTNGSTAISLMEKKSLIKLMMEPSLQ